MQVNIKKKIMVVMVLSSGPLWEKSAGGVDSVCQMLLSEMIQKPDDHEYLVIGFDPDIRGQNPYYETKLTKNMTIKRYPFFFNRANIILRPVPNVFFQHLVLRKEIRDFKPDLLHVHVHSWLLAKQKSRTVLTLHSYGKYGRNSAGFFNDLLYEKIFLKLAVRNANAITTVSSAIQEVVERQFNTPVHLIPNPVSNVFFEVNRKEVSKSAPIRLIMINNVTKKKRVMDGLAVLTKLKEQFPGIQLCIAGGYSAASSYYQEIQKYMLLSGLQDSVKFMGPLSTPELCRVFESCALGLFLSEEETFGLAPLEMLAAGLPLISTKVGILKKWAAKLSHYGVRFVEIGDISGIVSNCKDVIETGAGFEEGLRNLIRKEFDVTHVLSAYRKVYAT